MEQIIGLLNYIWTNKEFQGRIVFIIALCTFFILATETIRNRVDHESFEKRFQKLEKMERTIMSIAVAVDANQTPVINNYKRLFKMHGIEGWQKGKEQTTKWVEENHTNYYNNPELYKKKIFEYGQNLFFEMMNNSKVIYGEKIVVDYKILSQQTMPSFIWRFEVWIDKISYNKKLPKEWKYEISEIFDKSIEEWLELMESTELSIYYKNNDNNFMGRSESENKKIIDRKKFYGLEPKSLQYLLISSGIIK